MGLLACYQKELESAALQPDAEQRSVITKLDAIGTELAGRAPWSPKSDSLLGRLFSTLSTPVVHTQGLYLWGGVGRGKTRLCDLFFDNLPFADKTRLHFHRFMQQIHNDLRLLGEVESPLEQVADDWASRCRLLLLDEIHVHDITDAMLLGGLLSELFKRGVTLVTTSNVPPDGLYRDGLQRARFLPAIEAIKSHTCVRMMSGETDYRLRLLQTEPIYLISQFANGSSDADTQHKMVEHFDRLKTAETDSASSIAINQRDIPIKAIAGDLVWFSFDALCNTSRSTHDYIEIASMFHTVMISDVPVLDHANDDAARRLVNLVDEFYDRSVKVIMSAEAPPEQLYLGKRLIFEFVRAASRLTEMQTVDYLSAERAPAA